MRILFTTAFALTSLVPGLAAADHIETLYPGKGLTVVAKELPNAVEFTVDTPSYDVLMTIQVDRNQNGKVDARVDALYSRVASGRPCMAYLMATGRHGTTPCGEFKTKAKLVPDEDKRKGGYVLTVPKSELSMGANSVKLSFWASIKEGNEARNLFYPSEFFEKTVEFKYQLK